MRNAKRFVTTPWAIGRPELSPDLRSCAHGNYLIFFESATEQVIIVRILHGARDIPEVLNPSYSLIDDLHLLAHVSAISIGSVDAERFRN
jgi:hypothetical protein